MKTYFKSLAVFGALLIVSCQGLRPDTTLDLGEYTRYLWEKKHPPAESTWNCLGMWIRIAEVPPQYVPKGYARDAPRDDSHGRWIRDERDGKMFFVPTGGVAGISEGAILNDAIKNSRSLPTYYRQHEWTL
jgi:hypothetical protein